MPESGGGQPVVIDVGACRCPGGPHARDSVEIAPELTLAMGSAAWIALRSARPGESPSIAAVQARLTMSYLAAEEDGGCIIGWSFTDAEGLPVPVTRDAVERLIPWHDGGASVVEAADARYSERLLAPFLRLPERPSQPGPTAASTPPTPPSGSEPPTPSRPSSRASREGGRPSGDRAA